MLSTDGTTALAGGQVGEEQAAVREVARRLAGSFSSAAQAAQDPDFLDIRLHMAVIWPDRADGPWLYVEQAAAAAQERPYRQRVYRLVGRHGGEVESIVYELPDDPLRYAGAWKLPNPLADIRPEQLKLRQGCSVLLARRPDGGFEGSTQGRGCPSSLRGAAYATSHVRLTDNTLESWDRGFDDNDVQVWGATKGPYVFTRIP